MHIGSYEMKKEHEESFRMEESEEEERVGMLSNIESDSDLLSTK